jgi:hypothetical protein
MTARRAADGAATSEVLLARKDELASVLTDALYEAHPEFRDRYGDLGREKCLQDMRYTLEHLAPSVALGEPRLFAQYVVWLVDLLRPRGIPPEHVGDTMRVLERVLTSELSSEHIAAVQSSVAAGLAAVPRVGA